MKKYKYNWQLPDWPHFKYDLSSLHANLFRAIEKMGLVQGTISHLTADIQKETFVDIIVEEAIKTSEIEGEFINRQDVRSSIRNKFGLNKKILPVRDKRAQGITELMLDVHDTFNEPLTDTKLFDWHLMLLSSVFNPNLRIGCWRTDDEPMQIISSHYGRKMVHYEAPPSKDVSKEMKQFIRWFNESAPGKSQAIEFPPVRAAIAHLYFESIHPFDDGNGRIGRAVAEKALSQGFGYPMMLSLSHTISMNKKKYYEALHAASRSNEITAWLHYFIVLLMCAQNETEDQINFILKKTKFFDRFEAILNERQLKVIKRMLKAGLKGFEGGMSAKKYMKIADTSKATATRDLQHLLSIRAVEQSGSGRNIRYALNLSG